MFVFQTMVEWQNDFNTIWVHFLTFDYNKITLDEISPNKLIQITFCCQQYIYTSKQ